MEVYHKEVSVSRLRFEVQGDSSGRVVAHETSRDHYRSSCENESTAIHRETRKHATMA